MICVRKGLLLGCKKIIIFILFINVAKSACVVNSGIGCKENEICMNLSKSTKSCIDIGKAPNITFKLPFEKGAKIVCTHSKGVGSHSWRNSFYAIDLGTEYDKPRSKITAAADGVAYVLKGEDDQLCSESKGTAASSTGDSCGNGWGNRVKIHHGNGYFSFYTHLKSISIKNGQKVQVGDVLGVEGWTGLAGHRHLHWSVQKINIKDNSEFKTKVHWDGVSVPFTFKAILNDKIVLINTKEFYCPHKRVGEVSNQPILYKVE